MPVFREALRRRHGEPLEEIAFLLGSLKWADGSPVDPTMWQDWLAAVQMAAATGSGKIPRGRHSRCHPAALDARALTSRLQHRQRYRLGGRGERPIERGEIRLREVEFEGNVV